MQGSRWRGGSEPIVQTRVLVLAVGSGRRAISDSRPRVDTAPVPPHAGMARPVQARRAGRYTAAPGPPHPTASWHDSPVRTAFLSRLLTRFGTLPPFEQVAHFKKHKSSETPPFRFVLLFLFPSPNEIRGAERHLLKPRPLQATPHEALQEITDVHVDGPRACGNTPVRKCASAAFGSRVFKRARSILEISTSSL